LSDSGQYQKIRKCKFLSAQLDKSVLVNLNRLRAFTRYVVD
jgi:hypothetical protein